MERKEWKFEDDFGSGPWESEPDKIQWQDQKTGFVCLIVRNHMGVLCGYVGVAMDHQLYGEAYNEHYDLECHGGLTFSGVSRGEKICPAVKPGEDDKVWWFGFDCAHGGDYIPIYEKIGLPQVPGFPDKPAEYRNVEYVTGQVELLAQQLWEP